MLLFRDLIRLFACYNDAIINLLEKFFEMNRKQAREALDIYKRYAQQASRNLLARTTHILIFWSICFSTLPRFLIRMDRVAEFLKVAENVGIDKGEIPDLTRAPSSLLEALEGHLAALEGDRPGKSGKSKKAAAAASGQEAAAPSNGSNDVKKALEEEAKAMNQLKVRLHSCGAFSD